MITSRKLEDLLPSVKEKVTNWLAACAGAGVDVLVTCTLRDDESQNCLYAQGRTVPGPICTKAKGGESFHNFRLAIDIVPIVNGKPLWTTHDVRGMLLPTWQTIVTLAKKEGLEWAGDWIGFKEYCHFQDSGGKTLKQLRDERAAK